MIFTIFMKRKKAFDIYYLNVVKKEKDIFLKLYFKRHLNSPIKILYFIDRDSIGIQSAVYLFEAMAYMIQIPH